MNFLVSSGDRPDFETTLAAGDTGDMAPTFVPSDAFYNFAISSACSLTAASN